MSSKTTNIIGWVFSAIVGSLILMSAFLKLTMNGDAVMQATAMGIQPSVYQMVGVVEIVSLLLFFIPRTGVLGAMLLIAYMGGAIATHLQHQQPITIAVSVQVFIWIAAALRFPELSQRLFPIRHKNARTLQTNKQSERVSPLMQ